MGGSQTGGQAEDLLRGISIALPRISDKLEMALERNKELEGEVRQLRDRIVDLEAADRVRNEWSGEERRKVEGRLESGDHTFLKIENKADQAGATAERAYNMAKTALAAVDAATSNPKRDGTSKVKKHWWKIIEIAAPFLIPMIFSILASVFSYLAFLAKIASTIKQTGGHP